MNEKIGKISLACKEMAENKNNYFRNYFYSYKSNGRIKNDNNIGDHFTIKRFSDCQSERANN